MLGREREKEREFQREKTSHTRRWDLKVNEGSNIEKEIKYDNFKGKATTFFFTNFPESWNEKGFWNIFLKYGRVVDVFIPRKRNKAGKLFGFARFLNIMDSLLFEKKLNEI